MARVARTIRQNLRGILIYFRRRLASGVIEGINCMAQAARARARGYRSPGTFKAMICLLGGRLQFSVPSLTHCWQLPCTNEMAIVDLTVVLALSLQ